MSSCCSQSSQNFWRTDSSGQYPKLSSFDEEKFVFLNKHQTSASIVQTFSMLQILKINTEAF